MSKTKAKYSKELQFTNQLKNIFKSKSVLISILVLLAIVIFYNFMSKITMPFLKLPTDAASGSSLLEMLNLLGGGGLTNMSIFAIGISPYITTQIIVQLLSSDVIPPLAKLSKSGEKGRRKIEMISRVLTLPFAILQAFGVVALFSQQGIQFIEPGTTSPTSVIPPYYMFFYVSVMVAGTYIAIFLSDLITKKGVGNGVTTIILIGIVSSIIPNFTVVYTNINSAITNGEIYQIMAFIVYILFYFGVLWVITFVNCSVRKIPIQQTGQSLMKLGDDLPYLPFKLNTAGVIPVIFASSLMTLPLTIGEIAGSAGGSLEFANAMKNTFGFTTPSGVIIYVILIILFTFFYSYVQLNPNRISQDFMKSGRFIIGVKIGKTTESYISRVLYRINCIGAPFLAVVAALPYVCSMITENIIPASSSLGGTGIIIMITGSLDL